MRVLYVIDSLGYGGAERSLVEVTPGLLERSIDLEIAVLTGSAPLADRVEGAGATVTAVAGTGSRTAGIAGVRRLIRHRRPDIVHTTLFDSDVTGRVAAFLEGVPVVSTWATEGTYSPQRFADPSISAARLRAAQAVDIATCGVARRFHAVSERVAEVGHTRLLVGRRRIDVIPRGRDPEPLGVRTPERRERARAGLGITPAERVVLAVARHEYAKGVDLLLQAWARLTARTATGANAPKLLVAGREGNETEALYRLAAELGIEASVRWLGVRDDVADLMACADVFALSSRWEGFPGTVLEAMALEAPVVAFAIPGVLEALGPLAAGAVVAVGDVEAFADRLAARLAGSDDAELHAARERFLAEFTIGAIADRMVGFYERALG